MKLDMHLHTKEGSPDSKITVKEYIEILKDKGYDSMLITDHDSYNGYRYYMEHKDEMPSDFVVLRGIEYDTFEAGHFIVIMPDDVDLKILECRGLHLHQLIDIVHRYGGIIGAAHPCGEPFLSVFSTGRFKHDHSLANSLDFIEGYNCGEDNKANQNAQKIATEYGLPVTAGSDSHFYGNPGLAYTILESDIHNCNELIEYIKAKKPTKIWGTEFNGTIKAKLGIFNKILVYGFFFYNKFESLVYWGSRIRELKKFDK